jgi:hypothetical protein
MPNKNKSKINYKQQMKDIRQFVDFDYDLRQPLSSRAKGKINDYFNEIQALTARPNQVYRPRRKDRLKAAQEFAQHENRLKGIDVAFIPTNGNEKRKIKFDKNNNITAISEFVETRVLPINPLEITSQDSAENYISELIKDAPDAKSFTVLTGNYEIPAGQSRNSLPRYIGRLVQKYAIVDDEGNKANKHYDNWLFGVAAHNYKNQDNFQDYQSEKNKNKKEMQRKRKNKKRSETRKNNK